MDEDNKRDEKTEFEQSLQCTEEESRRFLKPPSRRGYRNLGDFLLSAKPHLVDANNAGLKNLALDKKGLEDPSYAFTSHPTTTTATQRRTKSLLWSSYIDEQQQQDLIMQWIRRR